MIGAMGKKEELSGLFERLADVLEFKGENPFKSIAYRKAARTLLDLDEEIETIVAEGRLRSIPGIGEGIAKKILEYLETGQVKHYEEARAGIPDSVLEIMNIPGMGPKTTALVYKELGIKSVDELEAAASAGKLRELPGMGAKKEENILRGIRLVRDGSKRILLGVALPIVEAIIAELSTVTGVEMILPAGSLRRMKETVGDIDILAASEDGRRIVEAFTSLGCVREVLAAGDTKGSIITQDGLQVDLRVVKAESFGAALQYFTGSKDHNVALRRLAQARGLKINEYGVFRGEERIAGTTEEEVYRALDLPLIPPELREDRGEIEAAQKGELPRLVEFADVKGDFHVHTTASDGHNTIEEMVEAAVRRGYKYIAICDHSKSTTVANGLDETRLLAQVAEIRKLQSRYKGIRILAGSEVDIRNDGTLDFPDEVLGQLDIVIAAVHSALKRPRDEMTRRILKAMDNPHVRLIAHPTGRLLGKREPSELDMEAVLKRAAETGVGLEINAQPDRLDLDDRDCRRAQELGVKVAIGTDAHDADSLWYMRLGVGVARRGWVGKDSLLNTFTASRLEKVLRRS